jgi:hypothetical protein
MGSKSSTRWLVTRSNRKDEVVHYLSNEFYMSDDYAVTCFDRAQRFDTYEDAQRAIARVAHRGISTRTMHVFPIYEPK